MKLKEKTESKPYNLMIKARKTNTKNHSKKEKTGFMAPRHKTPSPKNLLGFLHNQLNFGRV
ncbi:MAG: hypothetical protein GQ533_13560 [Methanosarcinaceae archaeon]|nr:hypothetical protein [Methanosarcinaceae archaeon]